MLSWFSESTSCIKRAIVWGLKLCHIFNLAWSVYDNLGRARPPTFEIATKAEPNPPTCDDTNMWDFFFICKRHKGSTLWNTDKGEADIISYIFSLSGQKNRDKYVPLQVGIMTGHTYKCNLFLLSVRIQQCHIHSWEKAVNTGSTQSDVVKST